MDSMFQSQIERYRQELEILGRRTGAVTDTPPTDTAFSGDATPKAGPLSTNDTVAVSPIEETVPAAETVPAIAVDTFPETPYTATLQVRVTAAFEALPLPNASVSISRYGEANPLFLLTTNISGLTRAVTLSATDPAQTLTPDSIPSLIRYTVRVAVPGYRKAVAEGLYLYGGIATVQPFSLTPLPEAYDAAEPPTVYRIEVPQADKKGGN